MSNHLISAIGALAPVLIVDLKTGETLSNAEHDAIIMSLMNHVQTTVNEYYSEYKSDLVNLLQGYTGTPKAAEYARQNSVLFKQHPPTVLAQSRVEKLIQHKLITETASWVNNPNPRKQEPTFSPKINLGAVDKQMAVLGYDPSILELTLFWKVWDRELLITFQLPSYILQRNIKKISLPTVQVSKKTGHVVYIFSVEEVFVKRPKMKYKAGVDLGRVEPFTLAILNQNNKRVAHYGASGRVKLLSRKRERLLIEKKHTIAKALAYEALRIDASVLRTEAQYLANKAKTLGNQISKQLAADVTKKLAKHEVSILNIEDLTWVHGVKYGSKWNHSQQQEAMTHALKRQGIATKKVSPKNTSQFCHLCGSTVAHNSRTRVAKCNDCKQSFDRDFNAAMNIARDINKNKRFPNQQSRLGDDCSTTNTVQIIDHKDQNIVSSNHLTRMIT